MIFHFAVDKRRCLKFIVLSIFFCVLFLTQYVNAQETLSGNELYAKSAVLMDAKTGRVLYEKNGYERLPMASTTKIMTCIIALENADPETIVTASAYAASMPKVHLGMREGEQFYLKDLLYSLMLESHNDTAVAVAEGVSGDLDSFLKLMNDKALELGCTDTRFLTPNGLDKAVTDEDGNVTVHSTTAADLARIMSYCINESAKSQEFLDVTRTMSHTFTDVSGKYTYSCNNLNAFLSMMEGALSGKTGFTNDAGYCYVGALRKDDKDLVVALLACGWPNNKSYKWSDTKKLMKYGLENYSNQILTLPEEDMYFDVADGAYDIESEQIAGLTAKAEIPRHEALLSETDTVRYEYEKETGLSAPVRTGDTIGNVRCYINDELFCEGEIKAVESVEKKSMKWAINEVLDLIIM